MSDAAPTRMTIERETVTVVMKIAAARKAEEFGALVSMGQAGQIVEAALAAAPPAPMGEGEPASRIRAAIADLQGEHEAMTGRFDPDRWNVEVKVTDLLGLLAAPTPPLRGQGSLQAASQPSVPTEGHRAAVVSGSTRGPWLHRLSVLSDRYEVALDLDGPPLAVVVDAPDPEETRSNAVLIACAPVLLALLTEVREACLYPEDDGAVGVTQEPTIDEDLFARICAAVSTAPQPSVPTEGHGAAVVADLLDALALILPLAKGYRPEGQTDTARRTCQSWIEAAEEAIAKAESRGS